MGTTHHRGVADGTQMALTRHMRRARRRVRQARMFVAALKSPYRPVLAHLIPIRRCNLACTYCNEFDDHSPPVPTPDLFRRVDRLAALGTGIVTLSGGEPLLHPDADEIIRHIREHGMIATLITNGYLLSRDRIGQLNRAGLDHLQISIDNVVPDEVSKKSLKMLDQKLRWLAEFAEFDVNVNSVVGGGIRNPEDARRHREPRAFDWGLDDGGDHSRHDGRIASAGRRTATILEEIVDAGRSDVRLRDYNRFQKNLANGRPNDWHCGAGSRYLYICEDGLVHWCSQQRGHPGIPLEQYGLDDLQRQYRQVKAAHRTAPSGACIVSLRSTSCGRTHRRFSRSGSQRRLASEHCACSHQVSQVGLRHESLSRPFSQRSSAPVRRT